MAPQNQLSITCETQGEAGILHLHGELMAQTRFDTERILREWHEGGLRYAVIDCADLKHIDSGGLSTLMGALHRYQRDGGNLFLVSITPDLKAIFGVASMEKYFTVFPSEAQALQHIASLNAPSEPKKKRSL